MIGWKVCRNFILLKVEVPENEIYLVCNESIGWYRATAVRVLEVIGGEYGISMFDNTEYHLGEIVRADSWTGAIAGCCHGIHFFESRERAERYGGIKTGHYGEPMLQ